jgi:hypothetical protein
MKKTFITLAILAFSYCSFAQNTFPVTGNVGIGTTTPNVPLNLYGTGDVGLAIESSINAPYLTFRKAGVNKWNLILERNSPFYGMAVNDIGFVKGGATTPSFMIQQSTGYVGIGTGAPGSALTVQALVTNNVLLLKQSNGNSMVSINTAGGVPFLDLYQTDGTTTGIHLNSNGNTYFNNGNVSIGTTDGQGYKSAVNGTAIATSMTVKLYANWPDFVFKPSYQLPALTDIKSYIDKNHHLPDVPSAAEVEKKGINLGEMNGILVQKVEELTLYLIKKDNEDKEKDIRLSLLQEQINQLKQQLNTVTKLINKN